MSAAQQILPVPVGLVKSFGHSGPEYEVVDYAGRSASGAELVRIVVVRTGETLDYDYAAMLADPEVQ